MYIETQMSQCMRFQTMWYVQPAKPQISLRIHPPPSSFFFLAGSADDKYQIPFAGSFLFFDLQEINQLYVPS